METALPKWRRAPLMRRRAYACSALLVAGALLAGCADSGGGESKTADSGFANSLPTPGTVKYPEPAGGNGGATARGVTAKEIKIGMVYPHSGPLPGIGDGAMRGAKAYVNYINSLGGVYGRKLALTALDDGLDVSKDAAACTQLASSNFAIVGSVSSANTGCAPVVKSTGIPWVGAFNAAIGQLYNLPNAFDATSLPPGKVAPVFAALKKQFPKVKKVGLLQPSFAAAYVPIVKAAYEKAGFEVAYVQTFDPTTPNLTPYVLAMRSKGVEAVDTSADPSTLARITQAMAAQSFRPTFVNDSLAYDPTTAKTVGAAGKGVTAGINAAPFLDIDDVAAFKPGGPVFLAQNEKDFPGKKVDLFTLYGWANTALFVEGIVKAGPALTSQKAQTALASIHDFSAGGLLGKSDPGAKLGSDCLILVGFDGSKWSRLTPTAKGTYQC
ncbi:ABC transporter substrate-binding protein [Streptomyces sp. NPDC002143]